MPKIRSLTVYIFFTKYKMDNNSSADKSNSSSSPSNHSNSSSSSSSSNSSNSSFGETKKPLNTAVCVSQVANWSHIKPTHLFDKPHAFTTDYVNAQLDSSSPKIAALLKKITEVDADDMKNHGHYFKHMIFSGQPNINYGAKIVISALISQGFSCIFDAAESGALHHKSIEAMSTDENDNSLTMLLSKPVYGKAMTTYFKKRTLALFNQRPENIHGDLVRFICLDGGFREGIDLFDIKYVHLLEPAPIKADERQAIGRGTRFCGQQGLTFHPTKGWPLFVYRYEVAITDPRDIELYKSSTFLDLQLKYSTIDISQINFAADLDTVVIDAAVDKDLTKEVHAFKMNGGSNSNDENEDEPNIYAPPIIMKHAALRRWIARHYKQSGFAYDKVKLENGCVQQGGMIRQSLPDQVNNNGMIGGANSVAVSFSPTQEFVRHFFQPSSAYKGMLLYHGVGTGKTCSAIATASTSFEAAGYTILWVTRHTLKPDIWKNMYRQVCSITMRNHLANVKNVSKKHLPPNWMEPISYKTFSNMLLKKNKTYAEMVRRNGAEDPLRKTLVIIDEAHKLYAPSTSAAEKPNVAIMERMIQASYRISGVDSVRILPMTATPYTESGMEMINLLNLLRHDDNAFPDSFYTFSNKYLDSTGMFTSTGRTLFKDDIAGYISYLNRSLDARNFAYPVITDIVVPMTKESDEPWVKSNIYTTRINEVSEKIAKAKLANAHIKVACKKKASDDHVAAIEEIKAAKIHANETKIAAVVECAKKPTPSDRKECKNEAAEDHKNALQFLKDQKEAAKITKASTIKECGVNDANLLDLIAKLNELKAELAQIKIKRMLIQVNINDNIKESAALYAVIKTHKNVIKEELKKIKAIPNIIERKERRKAMKESYLRVKQLSNNISALRQKKQNLILRKQVIYEKLGVKKPEETSQSTKIFTKCNLHFTKYTKEGAQKHEQQYKDQWQKEYEANKTKQQNQQQKPQPQQNPQPQPQQNPQPQPQQNQQQKEEQERQEQENRFYQQEEARLNAIKPTVSEFMGMLQIAYSVDRNPATAKKAYLKLSLKYHPDKHPDSPADNTHRFKNLQQAWTKFKLANRIQGGYSMRRQSR